MISEINVYSDGTVISLNNSRCLVPIASGTWAVLIDIYNWYMQPDRWKLPDECQFCELKAYFVIRSTGKETRYELPISHVLNMGKTMMHIAELGYKPTEVIAKEIAEKIIREYERE